MLGWVPLQVTVGGSVRRTNMDTREQTPAPAVYS